MDKLPQLIVFYPGKCRLLELTSLRMLQQVFLLGRPARGEPGLVTCNMLMTINAKCRYGYQHRSLHRL